MIAAIVGKIGAGQHHLAVSLCMAIACSPTICNGVDDRPKCQNLISTGQLNTTASVTLEQTQAGLGIPAIQGLTIEIAPALQNIKDHVNVNAGLDGDQQSSR